MERHIESHLWFPCNFQEDFLLPPPGQFLVESRPLRWAPSSPGSKKITSFINRNWTGSLLTRTNYSSSVCVSWSLISGRIIAPAPQQSSHLGENACGYIETIIQWWKSCKCCLRCFLSCGKLLGIWGTANLLQFLASFPQRASCWFSSCFLSSSLEKYGKNSKGLLHPNLNTLKKTFWVETYFWLNKIAFFSYRHTWSFQFDAYSVSLSFIGTAQETYGEFQWSSIWSPKNPLTFLSLNCGCDD